MTLALALLAGCAPPAPPALKLEIAPSERGSDMVHVPAAVVRSGRKMTPPVDGFAQPGGPPGGGAPGGPPATTGAMGAPPAGIGPDLGLAHEAARGQCAAGESCPEEVHAAVVAERVGRPRTGRR